MRYRPEIDGLRAVAVVPVILFHAGFSGFSGGFLGVDIFFFISGYLISRVLIDDIEAGRFSALKFYERRARRILPALFTVLAACFPFALAWLLPEQLQFFGKSVLATLAFVSNLLFAQQTGYFGPDAHVIPLVHTWSLSVEEQFYLVFPLLLAGLLLKLARGKAVVLIAALAAGSYLYAAQAAPDDKAMFYLTTARAWELLAGSVCAFVATRFGSLRNTFLSLSGLLAILAAIFLHQKSDLSPDPYAFLAVVGTALCILFGSAGTLTASILSLRPLVGIGLVSYSAYLWHQPIFAFARLRAVVELPAWMMVFLVGLTFLLAFLTWRYVEEPVRRGTARLLDSPKSLFGYGAAVAGALACLAVTAQMNDGLISRFSPEEQEWIRLSDFRNSMADYGLRTCFIDRDQTVDDLVGNGCAGDPAKPRAIVFGDSEAAHLMAGAREFFASTDYNLVQWTATGCKPFAYDANSRRCINVVNAFFFHVLPTLKPDDIVVVGANWSTSRDEIGSTSFSRAVKSSLMRIARQPAKAIVVGDVPNFAFNPLLYLVQNDRRNSPELALPPEAGSASSIANDYVRKAAEVAGFQFIDPANVFCPEASRPDCLIMKDRQPLYFDGNHLSSAGSRLLFRSIEQQ